MGRQFIDLSVTSGPNRDKDDLYVTPTWATRVLLEEERFKGPIWEPACGDGTMAKALMEGGYVVTASDLHDHGFGLGQSGIDFLDPANTRDCNSIVTNPPFRLAEAFVHRALKIATHKVAMFCRLTWLEGSGRGERLFDVYPPDVVYVMRNRVLTAKRGTDPRDGRGGAICYAWYVWHAPYIRTPTTLRWLTDDGKP